MKKDKEKIIQSDLSRLLKKYAKSDVIFTMEKEYQATSTRMIEVALIDDNAFLKKLKPNEKAVKNLADSIKDNGMIAPLVLRAKKDHYEVIIGRKRLFSARLAGMKQVPCLVHEYTDEETLLILLAVTRDEHDTNAVEMAFIAQQLVQNYHYTQGQIALLAHLSRPQITNMLRLLNLPDSVIASIAAGRIQYGHARSLITLPESMILEMAKQIEAEKLTVREVEDAVSLMKGKLTNEKPYHDVEAIYDARFVVKKNTLHITFKDAHHLKDFIEHIKRK